MDAGIHDAAAADQLARAPPAAGRIDVVGVVIDVQGDHLAERALIEQLPGLAKHRRVAVGVGDHQHHARLPRRRDHLVRLGGGTGDRLLQQDMLAGRRRLPAPLQVQVVGQRQQHGVDGRVRQQFARVGIGVRLGNVGSGRAPPRPDRRRKSPGSQPGRRARAAPPRAGCGRCRPCRSCPPESSHRRACSCVCSCPVVRLWSTGSRQLETVHGDREARSGPRRLRICPPAHLAAVLLCRGDADCGDHVSSASRQRRRQTPRRRRRAAARHPGAIRGAEPAPQAGYGPRGPRRRARPHRAVFSRVLHRGPRPSERTEWFLRPLVAILRDLPAAGCHRDVVCVCGRRHCRGRSSSPTCRCVQASLSPTVDPGVGGVS